MTNAGTESPAPVAAVVGITPASHLVVSAEDLEPTPVEHSAMVSVKRWPTPGITLPVTVDLADPTRLKIDWDDVQTNKQTEFAYAKRKLLEDL